MLAAIAPTIIIATATRVQSKRVELATQAARTFIDGVKTGAVTSPDPSNTNTNITITLPATKSLDNNLLKIANMPVPTTSTSQYLYCAIKDTNNNLTILKDPDCTSNPDKIFYIQAAKIIVTGSTPADSTGIPKDGYRLGIRVYRSDIDFTNAKASNGTDKKTQNTFTGTLGDRQSPLVEMTTEIGSRNTSFNALCQRLAITPADPSQSTSNSTCN
jgi:type II secretory pathway pseudopilin PulG